MMKSATLAAALIVALAPGGLAAQDFRVEGRTGGGGADVQTRTFGPAGEASGPFTFTRRRDPDARDRPYYGHRPDRDDRYRKYPNRHPRPYVFYKEREPEPRTEVVVIEKPVPAPAPPAEPPAPAPRIDACRAGASDAATTEQGSGRVLFMPPPEDGCPRFSRAPAPPAAPEATADAAPGASQGASQ